MHVQRLDRFDRRGRHPVQADRLQILRADVRNLVDEPRQEGLGIVCLSRPEMREELGRKQHADPEFPALEQHLPKDIEIVLHDVVRLVDEKHRVDEAKLRVLAHEGLLREVDHVLVVQVQEQHEEHVAFLFADTESREVDDRDAVEELFERLRVGCALDEDLEVMEIGKNAVRGIHAIADEAGVLTNDVRQRRRSRGVGVVRPHYGRLQVISLSGPDAAVYLVQNVVQELDAAETRRRQMAARGRQGEHVERNPMRAHYAGADRANEVRLRVVTLVVENQELRGMAAVARGMPRELVDQRLRQLSLSRSKVADDADVELIQPGVAGMQVVRLRIGGAEALPDGEANPDVFLRRTARRARNTRRHVRRDGRTRRCGGGDRAPLDRLRSMRGGRRGPFALGAIGGPRAQRLGPGRDQGLDALLPKTPDHDLVRVATKPFGARQGIVSQFDGIDRTAQPDRVRALLIGKQHLKPFGPTRSVLGRGQRRLAAGHEHLFQHLLTRRDQRRRLVARRPLVQP